MDSIEWCSILGEEVLNRREDEHQTEPGRSKPHPEPHPGDTEPGRSRRPELDPEPGRIPTDPEDVYDGSLLECQVKLQCDDVDHSYL